MQRREVFYSGRVQGVGFRYTATTTARHYAVTGFIENVEDGRVHLVVEGEEQEITAFLTDLAERMGGNIRRAEEHRGPATGQWTSFRTEH
jgi:acylphosphatase